jgi:hypothetical protein
LDAFANETGRNVHLTGEIAKAFGAQASELFAVPPQVEKVSHRLAKLNQATIKLVTVFLAK